MFWTWVVSKAISFLVWLHGEIILMGRWPRVTWQPTPFKVASLIARVVGVAAPFAAGVSNEGWTALTDPEYWALVPLTLAVSVIFVTIPLWIAIKTCSGRLRRVI